MPRYKLTIEYDGTDFYGWQKQRDVASIQETIEQAIYKFCGDKTEVYGAGRTDSGVHATMQVAHVDLSKEWEDYKVRKAVNFHLSKCEYGRAISILDVDLVDDEFHARFSAVKRSYVYKIINREARLALDANRLWHVREKLDVDAMMEAAQHFIGLHDFTSFRAVACQSKSAIKTIDSIDVVHHKPIGNGEELLFYIEAKSFLHHQVRNIVGTLKAVGTGKLSPNDIPSIFEARDRREAGATAPACGLYLTGVYY